MDAIRFQRGLVGKEARIHTRPIRALQDARADPKTASDRPLSTSSDTIDPAEIARFDALADRWWDPKGPMRALHRLNPLRLSYIRDKACHHFGSDPLAPRPLADLRVLDIGCGGGLLSEPLYRLGADLVAADASAEAIDVARHHAAQVELEVDYRETTAEMLAANGEHFDVVVAMEILEHVGDIDLFVESLGSLITPGGILFAATLNRTLKAHVLAIVGAEWVLGWLPRGTHQWSKFLRPSEVARGFRRAGLELADVTGVSYHLITDGWRMGSDTDVNYLVFAVKR